MAPSSISYVAIVSQCPKQQTTEETLLRLNILETNCTDTSRKQGFLAPCFHPHRILKKMLAGAGPGPGPVRGRGRGRRRGWGCKGGARSFMLESLLHTLVGMIKLRFFIFLSVN